MFRKMLYLQKIVILPKFPFLNFSNVQVEVHLNKQSKKINNLMRLNIWLKMILENKKTI
ncbi:hypothetical protein IMG5_089040 [Ichthyophthirius multifiliis]|uniref:Uncharacterized protein n=1 Tax=Ichthyophthirius multifiliis TaxID=5932 RepID=G0QR59_ICHMU|nr:hypothetical protein IMG5_089040 [Ichthyophthirius multifiliis]EGR32299.1 hypothetical protein IMG5_089040 [Ichthyophthirius multifiliis]|eukprot:XP_004035785.1 hypothetical protein IMG5_089040 [Ichthyophthirius multifiliis]